MIRLRSRSACPPGGFQYTCPKTGWKSWRHSPETRWNFDQLVKAVRAYRMAHPELGMSTVRSEIANEVDQQEGARVNDMPGGSTFVIFDGLSDDAYPAYDPAHFPTMNTDYKNWGRSKNEPIVVLPVCDRDSKIMLKNLKWMRELGALDYNALISQDASMMETDANEIIKEARTVFEEVKVLKYPRPPLARWPHAANWAFQCTARLFSNEINKPFFWMEADCVPLKRGWLDEWSMEYKLCGKPIMGSIVPGFGHCNGTAIYPGNFARLSAKAMNCKSAAWDWEMKAETIQQTHHSKLLCHVWGIVDGQPSPISGTPASFRIPSDVQSFVCPGAVLFHRCKDGTLIDFLRNQNL